MIKRLVTIVLCLAMLFGVAAACSVSPSALCYLRGDADGDGEISAIDAVVVLRVEAGLYTDDDGSITTRAAVTGGKTLTVMDATAIQRYLALLNDAYNIGEVCGSDATEAPTSGFVLPTQDNQLPIIRV